MNSLLKTKLQSRRRRSSIKSSINNERSENSVELDEITLIESDCDKDTKKIAHDKSESETTCNDVNSIAARKNIPPSSKFPKIRNMLKSPIDIYSSCPQEAKERLSRLDQILVVKSKRRKLKDRTLTPITKKVQKKSPLTSCKSTRKKQKKEYDSLTEISTPEVLSREKCTRTGKVVDDHWSNEFMYRECNRLQTFSDGLESLSESSESPSYESDLTPFNPSPRSLVVLASPRSLSPVSPISPLSIPLSPTSTTSSSTESESSSRKKGSLPDWLKFHLSQCSSEYNALSVMQSKEIDKYLKESGDMLGSSQIRRRERTFAHDLHGEGVVTFSNLARRISLPGTDEKVYVLKDSDDDDSNSLDSPCSAIEYKKYYALESECHRELQEIMSAVEENDNDTSTDVEEVIFDCTQTHPTYYIHWYPASPQNFDKVYDENGPLHRYDQAFGTASREYELMHNVKQGEWEGHCDKAAVVVSILKKPPKKRVTMNGIVFRPYDIKGLLVKIIHTFPVKMDYIGKRYPDGPLSDPKPSEFIEKLKAWNERGRPVIIDTDRDVPVWNYPYDKVTIRKNDRILSISSTGHPDENRKYIVDLKLDAWMRELNFNQSKNPDFLWMVTPEKDPYDLNNWPVENHSNMTSLYNPHVSPRKVMEIYMQSIEP